MKAICPNHGLRSRRQVWSDVEIAKLRRLYPDSATADLVRIFRRPISKVYAVAARLGLNKSAAFHANAKLSGRFAPLSRAGEKYRYPKGHVPANKGTRRPGWSAGRMRETQFKKGRKAHEARNYVPIGTEKVEPKRNVLMRKMTDDPTIFPVKRWRPVHVMVWEAAHGPVPAGHICIFRPGMKTFKAEEITVDRLELVTFAENMRRNTIHSRMPRELVLAVYALGQLKRHIRKRERAHAPHD